MKCTLLTENRDHEQSYHSFMHKHLFAHIDIDPKDVHILNGNAENLEEECARYEEEIRKVGGIELFLGGKAHDFATMSSNSV